MYCRELCRESSHSSTSVPRTVPIVTESRSSMLISRSPYVIRLVDRDVCGSLKYM